MKILHMCLACFYIDNYAYQENILPKYHKMGGNEVEIIASTQTYIDNINRGFVEPKSYYNEYGIKVTRIPYIGFLPKVICEKLRIYKNVEECIRRIHPDIIFLHDIQFLSIKEVIRYKKSNPSVKVYADGHADYVNSAKGFISRYILHGLIYKSVINRAIPYIEKFYGTLPCRCDFMYDMYGIPKDKIEYLPFGADDELVKKYLTTDNNERIRLELQIMNDSFVIITGGKINQGKKGIFVLMDAVKNMSIPLKLIIFGSLSEDIKDEFYIHMNDNIVYVGWADVERSYALMCASDIAVFPCLHSTLWEQAAGLGLPCVIHYIEGYTHINLNDNCLYVENITVDSLREAIAELYSNYERYKENALKAMNYFSYRRIAEETSGNGEHR